MICGFISRGVYNCEDTPEHCVMVFKAKETKTSWKLTVGWYLKLNGEYVRTSEITVLKSMLGKWHYDISGPN